MTASEHAKNDAYALGKWSYASTLPDRFRKLAGEAFAIGLDQQANWLRDMAADFEAEAKKMRAEYDAEYPR